MNELEKAVGDIEGLEEEFKEFEAMIRKNAKLIGDFCESAGMSIIEAGVSAEFFGVCVKEAIIQIKHGEIVLP